MASTIELLLLALLSGPGQPPMVQTDATTYASGNVTTATAVTQAWPALPGTPAAGAVYTVETAFTGTWEGNSLGFSADIGGTWYSFAPNIASGAFSSAAAVAGWLKLTVRVTSATACKISLAGAIGETASAVSPGSGAVPVASSAASVTFGASDAIGLGVAFGSGSAGQGITCYGSTFTIAGA